MQNHHSNLNDDEDDHQQQHHHNSEEQIENTKKPDTFKTKIIPLVADSLFIHSDIRLKIYTTSYKQTINSICLPLPKFAQDSIIINPKAHYKHFLTKKPNETILDKELNERIKLLDKKIDQINQTKTIQTSTIKSNSM